MGNTIFRRILSKHEVPIVILGLDAVGKTTVLYQLKLGEIVTTIPTIGFNVETLKFKNISMVSWDVGGRDKIRPLHRHYYQNVKGLVYVLDCADKDRMEQAYEELMRYILKEEELNGIPLLILANKQDLPGAVHPKEISSKLINMDQLRKRSWTVFGTSAIHNDNSGLFEAFDWLVTSIESKDRQEVSEKWAKAWYPPSKFEDAEKQEKQDEPVKKEESSFLSSFIKTLKKVISNI